MNFRQLDELIRSKAKEISLNSDIIFTDTQDAAFKDGIDVDTDTIVIDGNGHVIDGDGRARIFNINAGEVTLINRRAI